MAANLRFMLKHVKTIIIIMGIIKFTIKKKVYVSVLLLLFLFIFLLIRCFFFNPPYRRNLDSFFANNILFVLLLKHPISLNKEVQGGSGKWEKFCPVSVLLLLTKVSLGLKIHWLSVSSLKSFSLPFSLHLYLTHLKEEKSC